MKTVLKNEFDYYLAHQKELVETHKGKVVVIKDNQVLGVYDNKLAALTETQKEHAVGTFLIQIIEPGDVAYTQTFHSRVRFG